MHYASLYDPVEPEPLIIIFPFCNMLAVLVYLPICFGEFNTHCIDPCRAPLWLYERRFNIALQISLPAILHNLFVLQEP